MIEDLIRRVAAEDDDAVEELSAIADAEPGRLRPFQQLMDYVGLVRGGDLDAYGDGAYYLHLHQPCGPAAVNYQQS